MVCCQDAGGGTGRQAAATLTVTLEGVPRAVAEHWMSEAKAADQALWQWLHDQIECAAMQLEEAAGVRGSSPRVGSLGFALAAASQVPLVCRRSSSVWRIASSTAIRRLVRGPAFSIRARGVRQSRRPTCIA